MSHANKYYTLLRVGKQQLNMDDDTYRYFLEAHGATRKNGRISATTMTTGELVAAVEDMKKLGFTPVRKSALSTSNWRQPRIKKITALWCTLADAGVVTNRSEEAMQAFCKSVMKSDKLQWANPYDLNNCIEALKAMADRNGVELHG